MKFTAATRATQGTSASRRLRREAKVPAILYGLNQPAAMIAIDHNEMFYALQKEKFHSSILTMELDGTEQLVVLQAVYQDGDSGVPHREAHTSVPAHG